MIANWKTRTLFHGNNLEIMRAMNSDSVDLIATDPPFNKGKDFHATPDSIAKGASFEDRWSWKDDVQQDWVDKIRDDYPKLMEAIESARYAHSDGMGAYMCFMAVRLLEMRRVLKPTGSIYLHCDPTASHYLKATMDAIFGWKNFRNEIVWCYTGPGSPGMRQFNRKHDTIFWYSVGEKWTFNADAVRIHHHEKTRGNFKEGLRGSGFIEGKYELAAGKVPETWWLQDKGNGLAIAARQKSQYVGYPTQKPLALYERMIRASSNEGDIVLDPFCGCATTLVAAENLKREWTGIDLWKGAHQMVIDRLRDKFGELLGEVELKTKPPTRTDAGEEAAPFMLTPLEFREPLKEWQMLSRSQMSDQLVEAQGTPDGLVCCAGCGRELEKEFMELDHILPRSSRGANDISNRILLCRPCNGRKSNILTMEGLMRENTKKGWMQNKARAKQAGSRAHKRSEEIKHGRLQIHPDRLA